MDSKGSDVAVSLKREEIMGNSVTNTVNAAAGAIRRATIFAAALFLVTTAACSSPEQKVEKYTQSGLEYLAKGDLGRANIQFQNALKIDETHVPALVGLTDIMEQRQDFRAMFGALQRIVRLDPENLDALVKLGKLYLIGNDEAQALEYAEKALKLEPENNGAMALKAAVALKVGDEAGAVELANKVLAADPGNAEAVAVIVTERVRAGDNEAALARVTETLEADNKNAVLHLLRLQILLNLGREDELRKGFDELIGLYPDTVVYRQMYASTLLNANDYAGARAQFEEIARIEPNKAEPIVDLVRIEYIVNGAEAAGRAFKNYVDAHPDNNELRFNYGHFLRQEGDLAGAEAVYNTLAQKKDKEKLVLRARNNIAGIRLLQGRKDEAKAILKEILAVDAGDPEALLKLASLKIDDKEYDSAIADLRTVINSKPDLSAAKLLMAAAFEAKGDVAFATSQYAQAVEESKKAAEASRLFARFLMRHNDAARAERVLVESLAVVPGDLDNLKLLAALRLSRQDWRGAEEVAKLIEQVNAAEPSAKRILGVALTGQENYSGAIEALSAANAAAPLAAQPLATLISAYLKAGRGDEAEKLLTDMIKSNANNYEARILLANVHQSIDSQEEMEATLRAAIAAAPERSEAVEMLYRTLIASTRYDDAESLLNSSIAAAPDNDAFRVMRADLMLTKGQPAEALDIYADILTRRPNDLLVSNNYASILMELKDDPASLAKALEVATALEGSDNPYFLDTLGWAQFRNGAIDGAIATLEKAVRGAEGFAEASYHLGAAYLAAGRKAEGRASLEKALSLAPEASFADKVRALLAQE